MSPALLRGTFLATLKVETKTKRNENSTASKSGMQRQSGQLHDHHQAGAWRV
ncbi:hypothetical protein K788_0008322 [Paraburkholderia caribensis MBA4]|uniref:Uncharacterized protein n=1 Tax=Paraburkholderia caribensis MBA4 TaxID=1323664 RepID=A0A0P0REL0_9BURK|nr:hypothetical protein K788_0008322 [Paraburkholderia caribensis MBA4]